MALHTLEMMVKMQTGDAISGLNHIESQILNLADQVSTFKPMEFVNNDQINNFASINEALRISEKLGNRVYERNLESYLQAEKDLESARNKAMAIADITGNTEKLASVTARYSTISNRLTNYYDGINEKIKENSTLFNNIVNSKQSILALTEKEAKFAKKIAKDFMDMKEAGVDIEDKFGITTDHFENLQDFSNTVKKDMKTWDSVLKETKAGFEKLSPELVQFTQILSPLKLLGDELNRVNKIYEDNHTVNNVFVADMYENATVTEAFADIQQEATKSGVLLAESQKALNAVLNSGAVYFENNNKLLQEYVENVSRATRATGISEGVIADLALRTGKLGEEFGKSTKLTDTFVNVMAENRLTTGQMSKIASVLQKDLSRLDREFRIVSKDGQIVASGSEVIATTMGEIAAAARDAGFSADAAMDMMTRAIEDPLSVAPLLQGALTSDSIGEQFLSMGENAEMFLQQMESMPVALQKTFAQKLGTTPEELRSMAAGSAEMRAEIEKLTPVMGEEAARAKVVADVTKERTDAQEAAKNSQKAQANASRELAMAMDQIRIVFGKVAVAMQPVLTFIAEFASFVVSNDISKWLLVLGGSLLAIVGPMKLIKTLGGGVVSVFKGMGDSVKGFASGGQGGGFKGIADSLAGFIERLSRIDAKGALKAALVVSAIGVALGIGVAAIGYAAQLLPPDKAAELAATLGGIVGAMFAIKMMGKVGKDALIGAGMLVLVGGALALGIYFIGQAINTFPPDKANELLAVTGILTGVMIVAGLMGKLGPTALLGAVLLGLVGGALALSIGWLGDAMARLPPDKALDLLKVASILSGVMVVAGLMGAVGPTALIGALLLIAVGMALATSVGWLGDAMTRLPSDKALDLLKVSSILVGVMGVLALLGPFAVPAMFGALGMIVVAKSLSIGISMLGKAVTKMSASKLKALVTMSTVLVATTTALSLIGLAAPLAMFGAAALVVVAGALAAAIGILTGLGTIDAFAESIYTIGRAMDGLNPRMGKNLAAVAAGLAAFGAALIGNDVVAWIFGVDFIESAHALGGALTILKEPIAAIAAIGPQAGNTFKAVGVGLKAMSESLKGGGLFDFFSGDMVENSEDISSSMYRLVSPIERIGSIGYESARAFSKMASGMKEFVGVMKESAGWFSSFEGNAEDMAAGLKKLSGPMRNIANINARAMLEQMELHKEQKQFQADLREAGFSSEDKSGLLGESLAGLMRNPQETLEKWKKLSAQQAVEEINSDLAVDVQTKTETDDPIILKLEEIRLLLEENAGPNVGGPGNDLIEEVQKSNTTLTNILEELSMGGSYGGSSYANTNYNT